MIHSSILGEDREYWVSLPPSYDQVSQSHKTYPILIVLDGHSLFRPVSGMLNHMSTSRNGSRRVPEMIVVGLQSSNRERDLTPDKIVTVRKNDTGGGDQFLSFIEKELFPVLQSTYRTSPYRVLVGHSLGGLLACHAYMQENSLFNAFIAIDPSFGTWDVATMDQKIETVSDVSFDRFLYIATANWGTRNLRNRDRHVRFYESLNRKNSADQFRAQLEYYEHENHFSIPLIAFYDGISSMFKGYGLTYRDVTSLEQLTTHYQTISNRLFYDFYAPEQLVERIGRQWLRGNDSKGKTDALALFELNTTYYPNSLTAHLKLAEAQEALGDKRNAIESYQRSLEIDPKNAHAESRLNELLKTEN